LTIALDAAGAKPSSTAMHRRHPLVLVTFAVAAVMVGACGGPSAPVDAGPFTGAEAVVKAVNIAYDPVAISLPTGVPLRLVLDNRDNGVPHDIKVLQGDQGLGQSPVVTGPAMTEVRVGPLSPGTYQYQCTVHPNMLGTLTITP
jgi:plastocyanin